jgi:hypothetical protein
MIYSLLFIYFNFLTSLYSITIQPKFCIDCKFFTKDFISSNKFGKCSLHPVDKNNKYFLVDGTKEKNNNLYHCSTARNYEDMCGKEGKYFVKKNNNIFKWKSNN